MNIITPDNLPNTTATEVMEIFLHVAKRLDEGISIHNVAVIAGGYQSPRLAAFLKTAMTPEGLDWLLEAHETSLLQSMSVYKELFAIHAAQIREAAPKIQECQVQITAVSAEDILVHKNQRWEHIVNNILPDWKPWQNRMQIDAVDGLRAVEDKTYSFKREATEKYLYACYPEHLSAETLH